MKELTFAQKQRMRQMWSKPAKSSKPKTVITNFRGAETQPLSQDSDIVSEEQAVKIPSQSAYISSRGAEAGFATVALESQPDDLLESASEATSVETPVDEESNAEAPPATEQEASIPTDPPHTEAELPSGQEAAPSATPRARKSRKKAGSVSQKKIDANRRNAQKSTGPKTEQGRRISRRNAFIHGLTSDVVIFDCWAGAQEDGVAFYKYVDYLREDLDPVGALEERLVAKIAHYMWREDRAARFESGVIRRQFFQYKIDMIRHEAHRTCPDLVQMKHIKDQLWVPDHSNLDRLLRYEGANHRQLYQAMHQLERLQRARKGEHVPAPVSVQVSGEP